MGSRGVQGRTAGSARGVDGVERKIAATQARKALCLFAWWRQKRQNVPCVITS